jgi:hypothetical protein
MLEENNIKIRKKLKKLSKNLDKNYYEILNIYKELIIEYYEYNKMD